jgi:hypothetical protein
MSRKYGGKIEIFDLIDDAVSNAVARRNQALEIEETLTALLEEEVGAIKGGLKIKRADVLQEEVAAIRGGQSSGASGIIVKYPPIVAGFIALPEQEI